MANVEVLEDFDDHPSLSASLEDFEHNGEVSENFRSPVLEIPAHHSGFYQSEDGDGSELRGSDSGGPFSPPAGRRSAFQSPGAAWFRHEPYLQERLAGSRDGRLYAASRDTSPQYESANEGDLTIAANIRLPTDSPLKRSPSPSPGPDMRMDAAQEPAEEVGRELVGPIRESGDIRFAVKAEVQHRTEAFEAAFTYFGKVIERATRTRTSTICSILAFFISWTALRLIFTRPPLPPSPDLIKVAGLAGSYEPLIFYSENSLTHIEDLQETGTAVWDLGESVRYSSIPSSAVISETLDSLSDNLKELALQLTRFFAIVDGDVDGIILVMAWAKGELLAIPSPSAASITTAFDNFQSLLSRVGVLEDSTGKPTGIGRIFNAIFGRSTPQRTHHTLQRTFQEFLGVLEDSINRELQFSIKLFALFDAIDREFFNVGAIAMRECGEADQEQEGGELLSSLWSRAMSSRAARLRKYERNKELLLNIRKKTLGNKHLVAAHHSKLLSLKMNLEILRTTLVSQMVRANDSSTMSVEQQVRGLDTTYELLRKAREQQKLKWKENIVTASERFSAAAGRLVLGSTDGEEGSAEGVYEIDAER
ncbi:MAG: hypothetical protein M4579_000852 [Chaenotheca gracillima]|nr:MAG: hypothetical protein M4579_000852 [Chaenotheca gracillima]